LGDFLDEKEERKYNQRKKMHNPESKKSQNKSPVTSHIRMSGLCTVGRCSLDIAINQNGR
jgi:hypothetical protein